MKFEERERGISEPVDNNRIGSEEEEEEKRRVAQIWDPAWASSGAIGSDRKGLLSTFLGWTDGEQGCGPVVMLVCFWDWEREEESCDRAEERERERERT